MEIAKTLDQVRSKLEPSILPHELDEAMDKIARIRTLKKDMNVVVLGHNYMTPDVFYGVSDIIGDSLGLAREAAQTTADIILFNGVHFMAETAKIMSPEKTVLIADMEAGCSLAESITAEDVRMLKKQHPGVPVVTYVNCSAAVKAETDICCTSANAAKVVNSLDSDEVLFLPDAYLAKNVALQTDKRIISWEQGKCMVHEQFTKSDIDAARAQFDDLVVISHPECDTDVTGASDFAGSTSQMERVIAESGKQNVMLITECSMGDNLRSVFPKKNFISTCQTCPHMKKITLDKIIYSLENMVHKVEVDEDIIRRGRRAVERMLEIG
ncbi:quinolinate synthase NadA [Salinispira pacifica]|uniref:Quinolinate synthase n=1 Tax=Salinispira pacifica TaxID=1307761 RepID=V5WJX9_9SPIO|nr:quinolinate synthase NadA [Salinispira pacifica]AHC15965.1 Quinolinate synthetase [Salinispira pacifica]